MRYSVLLVSRIGTLHFCWYDMVVKQEILAHQYCHILNTIKDDKITGIKALKIY